MHFILRFKYHMFNAPGWLLLPKGVAGVDGANKISCGWRLYVLRFLIYVLQRNEQYKKI